uniref:Uncharacterized protein n=1 Tax=Anopheles farauti TaxID=69004 RepID=A0A182QML5_9DIPT
MHQSARSNIPPFVKLSADACTTWLRRSTSFADQRSSLSAASGSKTSDRGEVGSRNLPPLFMLLLALLSATAASYSLPPDIRPSPALLISSSSFDTFLHFVICFSALAFSVSSSDSESESLSWSSASSCRSMSSVLPSCCNPPPSPAAAPPGIRWWLPLAVPPPLAQAMRGPRSGRKTFAESNKASAHFCLDDAEGLCMKFHHRARNWSV